MVVGVVEALGFLREVRAFVAGAFVDVGVAPAPVLPVFPVLPVLPEFPVLPVFLISYGWGGEARVRAQRIPRCVALPTAHCFQRPQSLWWWPRSTGGQPRRLLFRLAAGAPEDEHEATSADVATSWTPNGRALPARCELRIRHVGRLPKRL